MKAAALIAVMQWVRLLGVKGLAVRGGEEPICFPFSANRPRILLKLVLYLLENFTHYQTRSREGLCRHARHHEGRNTSHTHNLRSNVCPQPHEGHLHLHIFQE